MPKCVPDPMRVHGQLRLALPRALAGAGLLPELDHEVVVRVARYGGRAQPAGRERAPTALPRHPLCGCARGRTPLEAAHHAPVSGSELPGKGQAARQGEGFRGKPSPVGRSVETHFRRRRSRMPQHGRMQPIAVLRERESIVRYLTAIGEASEVPPRSPKRGPPYGKRQVLRRQALGRPPPSSQHSGHDDPA